MYDALLLFGSVSDHFGPSAFNKFGFGFESGIVDGDSVQNIIIFLKYFFQILPL